MAHKICINCPGANDHTTAECPLRPSLTCRVSLTSPLAITMLLHYGCTVEPFEGRAPGAMPPAQHSILQQFVELGWVAPVGAPSRFTLTRTGSLVYDATKLYAGRIIDKAVNETMAARDRIGTRH